MTKDKMMQRARTLATALTFIGFLMAALAGLLLATQSAAWGVTGTLVGAFVAFVLVLPIFGGGIYIFARASRDAELLPESDLPQQRALMALLKQRPVIPLAVAASEIGVSPDDVLAMIEQLAALDVFTGYLTPDGMLNRVEPLVMRALTECRVCRRPLEMLAVPVVCPQCAASYYFPR